MTKSQSKVFILIAFFCTALMVQTAYAEQAREPVTDPVQLTIQLPDVDRKALIEQIRSLRSNLIQRKQALVQVVADNELDSGDVIITAVMPGGLLYASYKKLRHEQAKKELARVSADIEEFSSDLLAMQSRLAPVALAQLH